MNLPIIVVSLLAAAALSANAPLVISPNSYIVSQQLFTLQASEADSELIFSPNFENLQLSPLMPNRTPATEFRMNVLDRTAPGNLDHYNFTLPGAWHYVLSSASNLACSLVVEEGQLNNTLMDNLGLLSFNSQTGELKVLGPLPFSPIAANNTLTID